MVSNHAAPYPAPIAIDIRLDSDAEAHPADARQELVLTALAAALFAVSDSASHAWTIRCLARGAALWYRLQPFDAPPPPAAESWELIRALRGQALIAEALPCYDDTPDGQGDGAPDYDDPP